MRVVTATWPMKQFQANFPMALDEANHRLFIGCRRPARLVVLDTSSGKPITDLALAGDTDDLFYDASRRRIYVSCGDGFVDVITQANADRYRPRARIPTAAGARTAAFSLDLSEFYLAVPARGGKRAEVRIFKAE